ncbi:MAG: DNA polymerase III subunit delta' [Deltaproteobacteria bacterium]|nr:MAG: DNA polymerase III subunit delta' [Deltaproteobacteria bacterium]
MTVTDPVSFTPIGQTVALLLIRKMIETGRLGGSYLFAGPQGVGKKTTARYLAMAANCERSEFPPCGECSACEKILAGNHPDVLTLSPPEGKQNLTIEQVRHLQGTLAYGPYEGKRRVVIIDPADLLGLEAANALLVTLESPPSHTLLILTTAAPYRLLETIRSRCQVIRFTPLTRDALAQIARRSGLTLAPDDPVLELSQGSVTRLMALTDPETRERYAEMDAFFSAVLTGEKAPDLIENPKWAKQRGTMEIFLERALWLSRDWALNLEGLSGREVVNKELIRGVIGAQTRVSREFLLEFMDMLFQSMEDLKHNAAPELIFDTLRLKMEEIVG